MRRRASNRGTHSKDNGGAMAQGVTKDGSSSQLYKGQPDPLQQAIVEGAGADTDPTAINQTSIDCTSICSPISRRRTAELKDPRRSRRPGGPTDATAAQATPEGHRHEGVCRSWRAGADTGVVPGTGERQDRLHVRDRIEPQDVIEKSAPYLWPIGPDTGTGRPALPGARRQATRGQEGASTRVDPTSRNKDRVFGWVQAETQTDQYKARNDASDKELADKYRGQGRARV